MYKKGLPLDGKDKKLLVENGYLEVKKKTSAKPKKQFEQEQGYVTDLKTEKEIEIDQSVDIVYDDEIFDTVDDEAILINQKVYSNIENDARFVYKGDRSITREDWYPKDKINHTEEFYAWINSFNSGFQKMIPYAPFQMYCQQANNWLAEKDSIYDYETMEARREFAWSEMERIKENSLYFLDKYLKIKEASMDTGEMQYDSKPAHKVMAFLFDCGYCVEMGKGRQMAATTTIAGLALCKLITTKNFFIKMIAQDKDKVQEIFDDKIKYPFAELPPWMHQTVLNDRDNLLYIGSKEQKGKKNGVNSKIQVVAPTVSAINGGAPPLVLIDEGGYISILGKMIKEARPTMFMQDPVTRKITMKRQIWIWGTGGEMDKKGKAFHEEYGNTIKKWNAREFEYGIIPIFFDWTTRPGATKEHYLKEKKNYTIEGPDAEESMVQFRQAYPSIIEDMFLTSSKTLVSIARINRNLAKIRELDHDQRAEKGYFMPVYDLTKPSNEHDELPYAVKGAEWVPCTDGDPRISTTIFLHPKKGWVDRYFQGTDPLMTDNGYSNMASAIWDAQHNTLAAIVNYRTPDHKETFLQCMLLGIYFDANNRGGVPDLVESNVGMGYCDWKQFRGFGRSLLLRTELPSHLQGGQAEIGIDNRSKRTSFIISKLHELTEAYGDNIYIETFWEQLSTFVCTITDAGNETWGTEDKRKYHDDVLFAVVFAYICSLSFIHRPPKNIETAQNTVKIKHKLVRRPDGTLTRIPVRKTVAA